MTILCPILANVITADMGFLPGLALVGPAFGIPLSVLAAVLERPFYTRAGIERWAVWYSLQANLVSLLIGYLLLPIAMIAFYTVGPLWLPVSVFFSIVIERMYLKRHARGFDGGWKRVSWANVFSALALVGVLMLSMAFNAFPNKRALVPYVDILTYIGMAAGVVAFAVSFIVPAIGKRRARMALVTAAPADATATAVVELQVRSGAE